MKVRGPCEMDLSKFPLDRQTCMLTLISFNYHKDEVRMRWKTDSPAISKLKEIILADYNLVGFDVNERDQLYPAGIWVELDALFYFERRYGFYIMQAYVPTYCRNSNINICLHKFR